MFFKKNVRVVIKNQNLALEVKTGTNLYQALVAEGIIPQTLCRGNGQCGKCKVHISQKNMPRPNKKEQLVLARLNLEAGFRLACQTTVKDHMVVDTSEITSPPLEEDFIVKPLTKLVPPPIPPLAAQPSPSKTATATSEREELTPAESEPDTNQPPQSETVAYQPVEPIVEEEVITEAVKFNKNQALDGLLLIKQRNQIRYFLYSAAIDSIAQEGTIDNGLELTRSLHNGMLSDYVHDQLKIKDIDRMIVLSDEPSADGESLFDMVSYSPFDIGPMPCELIRPLPQIGDLGLFLRLLSAKGKKRLIISLDKLDHTYYVAEDKVVEIPNFIPSMPPNLFDMLPPGSNPVVGVSDDLRTVTPQKQFTAPDSLPLPLLMKVAAQMVKKKLADTELRIHPRNRLDSNIPLEYIVKVIQYGEGSAFYLYRDKETSLLITQEMFNNLVLTRKFIHYAIEYTEANLGNIETITICTPMALPTLLDSMIDISLVPKRHENIVMHNAGDSSVIAVKLFQEPDVRSYIHKQYGTFIKSN